MIFSPSILYIDDEPSNLETFRRAFGRDFKVVTSLSANEALRILEKEDFALIIADQRMPGMTGIELCERLILLKPQSLRIILTAYTETQMLLDAIHKGHVHDYIVKPWRKSELKPILEKHFEDYKSRTLKLQELIEKSSRIDSLQEEIHQIYDYEHFIGASSGLKPVMENLKRAAPTEATVLLNGETGTGKELVARWIHAHSPQKNGPFIPVHCAAFARGILESELFGHEKGAFSGASETRMGRFEMAHNGTLFLDEIGEISEEVQVRLLRVLQEREIERVGGNRHIPVRFRLICATHKNLEKEVRANRFRQDLFFRIHVVPILLPPLREREEDIPTLAEYFLKKYSKTNGRELQFSSEAIETLKNYDWPGNVRELQNIIERATILAPGSILEPSDLNLHLDEYFVEHEVLDEVIFQEENLKSQIQAEEAQNLREAFRKARGNISETARLLGVARTTLIHRLKKYRVIS